MELEALGGFSGEVLDIGCGLGDNAIYLASRGHSATGLDGSPAAIEEARRRAADAADQMPPEALEQMREVTERFAKIADLLDDDRVYLPFTVVHAHRVD